MAKTVMYKKLCNVQQKLMAEEIPSVELKDLLPVIFKKCLEENMMFYFNFIENACVLNLRDITQDNMELNIRLYYPNENIDCKLLKEQVLINAFLLTKKASIINNASSAKKKDVKHDKPIKESNAVPPTAIRTVIDMLEKNNEPVTRQSIQKYLQFDKMSTDNRRRCIAYLKTMEE